MTYCLGVDLGTTFTAAALVRDGRVEPVTLGTSSVAVPSVAYLGDDGLVFANPAERRAATDPERVVREFKRRIGDPTPVVLGGELVSAQSLMARMLEWVVTEVAATEGGPPVALMVTHPANWGEYKRIILREAIEDVGIELHGLLPEPVAAATFYASQRELPVGTVVAVYDFGGGTFDAAIVRSGADGFEIIGQPDGIERLGGVDFDHAVLRHVIEEAGLDLDAMDGDADAAMAVSIRRVREECIAAKEALSAETAVAIPVMLPTVYRELRLTRTEFEVMIRPAITETLVALLRTIDSAGLAPADISAVLLVGGSSRIPLVAQLVMAELGRPIAVDARPKDAIPMGAALAAAARVRHVPGAAEPVTLADRGRDHRPGGPPIAVTPEGTQPPTGAAPHPLPPPTAPARPGGAGRRGRAVLAMVVGLTVLVLVVALGGGQLRTRRDATTSGTAGAGDAAGSTGRSDANPQSFDEVVVGVAAPDALTLGYVTTTLELAGYQVTSLTADLPQQDATSVLYAPGHHDAARQTAERLGLSSEVVDVLREPFPVDVGEAGVAVLAGRDLVR